MPNGPKLGPKLGFCFFLKFGSLVLLEIAYNDILQECLTSSSGEIHEEGAKSVPKLGLLPFSQVLWISFP